MEITRGKLIKAQKVVAFGPEGIGKSTFGSKFPKPIFIDIEGSTAQLEVDRVPRPTSWGMLMGTVAALKKDNHGYKSAIVDTVDWAERLGIEEICAKYQIASLGSNMNGEKDFGKSYNLWADEFGRFLNSLTELTETGMHVVLLAHARIRTQQVPEEFGAYDHWELKLEKRTSSLTKEWADMLLFLNYVTLVVEDTKTKTKKAQGGARMLYTSHHPCWDAKNRHGLPDELPFDFKSIAHCFPETVAVPVTNPTTTPVTPAAAHAPAPATQSTGSAALRKLRDMMAQSGVTTKQIQAAMAAYGHRPEGTPLEALDDKYIEGGLIANWSKVLDKIKGIAA